MADTTLPGVLLTGDHASRPAATAVASGTLYACSTHDLVYQSDAASWSTWATLGTAGGIPASLVTAKGDIIAATASGAVDNLAAGANDTVLMADSGQSTGLKWVASATPTDQDYDDVASAGTSDTYARGDHLHGMPSPSAGSAPDCYQTVVTSDVTIPNANTVQDVASLSLPAGDFLLMGKAAVTSGNTNQTQLTLALHDGTAIVDDSQVVQQSGIGGVTQTASVFARITLGGTTTVKLQVFSVRGSSDSKVEDTNTSNGTTDVATRLIALAVTAI